jgi:hypothetical protein
MHGSEVLAYFLSKICIVLKIILDRLQDLEIDDSKKEAIKPLPSFTFHGASHLPLRFTPGNLQKLG